MTKPAVLMPEPFEVKFERAEWEFGDTSRTARCWSCSYTSTEDYGFRMPTIAHWCIESRVLVIWGAA